MSLRLALFHVTARTAKTFEKAVRKQLEAQKSVSMVVRMDHKNRMPDFLVLLKNGKYFFLECKNYQTSPHLSAGIGKWMNSQRKQYDAFIELAKKQPVYVVMAAGSGTHVVGLNEDYDQSQKLLGGE